MNIEKRNVSLSYVYTGAAWFGITSLWVIYLGQQGLSLAAIGLCESIFHVSSFLFEVPSGVLADRFQYRTMLMVSRIVAAISALIMLASHSFLWFAISFIVSAWSYNLQSGTLEALVYESLPEKHRESNYQRIVSTMGSIDEIASTAGVIVAGMLVHWHFNLTYVGAIILAVVAGTVAFGLKEPAQHQAVEKRQSVKTIVTAAIQALRDQPKLRNLMLVDALLSTIATAYYYYFQDQMTKFHFSGWAISALMLVSSLIAVVVMQLLPSFTKRMKQLPLLLGLSAVLVGALLLTAVPSLAVGVAMYLVVMGVNAVVFPLFTNYYNAMIPDGQRATLLSVAQMAFSVMMVVIFPVVGFVIQSTSFALTFGGLGVMMAVLLVIMARRL